MQASLPSHVWEALRGIVPGGWLTVVILGGAHAWGNRLLRARL